MPMRRRNPNTLRIANTFSPSTSTWPSTRAPATKSTVRLMHLSSVVLPELAGPMMPKIERLRNLERQAIEGLLRTVEHRQVANGDVRRGRVGYHRFRARRCTRKAIESRLTLITRPIRTTAVAYTRLSDTPVTCVERVNR